MTSKLIIKQILVILSLFFLIIPFVHGDYISPITPRGIYGIVIMLMILYFFNIVIEFIVNFTYLSNSYSNKSELFFSVAYINLVTYPLAQTLGLLISILLGFFFFIYYIFAEIIIIYCEWRYLLNKVREKNTCIRKLIVFRSVLIANIFSLIILLIIANTAPPIYHLGF